MVMNSKSILGNPLREKIERDTEAFLRSGGKITRVPPGVSGDKSKFGRPARAVKGKPNAKQRRGLSAVMGREAWEDRA